jgi:hypothetical protein
MTLRGRVKTQARKKIKVKTHKPKTPKMPKLSRPKIKYIVPKERIRKKFN